MHEGSSPLAFAGASNAAQPAHSADLPRHDWSLAQAESLFTLPFADLRRFEHRQTALIRAAIGRIDRVRIGKVLRDQRDALRLRAERTVGDADNAFQSQVVPPRTDA